MADLCYNLIQNTINKLFRRGEGGHKCFMLIFALQKGDGKVKLSEVNTCMSEDRIQIMA